MPHPHRPLLDHRHKKTCACMNHHDGARPREGKRDLVPTPSRVVCPHFLKPKDLGSRRNRSSRFLPSATGIRRRTNRSVSPAKSSLARSGWPASGLAHRRRRELRTSATPAATHHLVEWSAAWPGVFLPGTFLALPRPRAADTSVGPPRADAARETPIPAPLFPHRAKADSCSARGAKRAGSGTEVVHKVRPRPRPRTSRRGRTSWTTSVQLQNLRCRGRVLSDPTTSAVRGGADAGMVPPPIKFPARRNGPPQWPCSRGCLAPARPRSCMPPRKKPPPSLGYFGEEQLHEDPRTRRTPERPLPIDPANFRPLHRSFADRSACAALKLGPDAPPPIEELLPRRCSLPHWAPRSLAAKGRARAPTTTFGRRHWPHRPLSRREKSACLSRWARPERTCPLDTKWRTPRFGSGPPGTKWSSCWTSVETVDSEDPPPAEANEAEVNYWRSCGG